VTFPLDNLRPVAGAFQRRHCRASTASKVE
jgi:hypothetical protein